jgi:hypothetical protein
VIGAVFSSGLPWTFEAFLAFTHRIAALTAVYLQRARGCDKSTRSEYQLTYRLAKVA